MTVQNGNKPVIGVIGGAGPDATINFQMELSKQMKLKLGACSDQEHYRVIVDNYCTMPDRGLSLSKGVTSPVKHMQEAAMLLEKFGCSILAFPCNTAHAFLEEIEQVLRIPIVNMLTATIQHVRSDSGINKVGILCTNMTRNLNLYKGLSSELNINICYPDDQYQAQVMQAIFATKAGYTELPVTNQEHIAKIMSYLKQESSFEYNPQSFDCSPKELFESAAKNLLDKGADAILLGCTEIPLCITESVHKMKIINPTQILAAAVVDTASKL